HALDDRRRPIITDAEPALNVAGRDLAIAQHDRDRLVVGIVRLVEPAGAAGGTTAFVAVLAIIGGDGVEIFRYALALEMGDDFLHPLVGGGPAVHALDAAAARHVEHVAHAEQLLGTLLAENGAAVDLRRHLEGDARREIRLDRAGDHVDRRALRRHDDMDAGGARHLGQTLDSAFDVLAGHHHQVGHLVDDHHDVRHRLEVERFALVDRLAGIPVEADLDGAGDLLALLQRLADALVEAVDVAYADLGHLAVTVLHLAHGPFQGHDGLLRVGDDRRQQMGNAVIDG